MGAESRVRVCRRDELASGTVRTASLTRGAFGEPRSALVVLDEDGEVRAYVNRCKHLPIPLDGGSGDFWDDSRTHLLCGTHGARYRISDGYCTSGPCEGSSLDRLVVIEVGGVIFVRDPGR